MKRFTVAALAIFLAMIPVAPQAAEETSQSAAPAASVTALLERLKLDAIVARDPEVPGHYVAALYIQGSQLLVLSAPYAVPAALDKMIAEGKFMDAYQSIQGVASHKGHFFVIDMQGDGLKRACEPDQPFDSTTMDGGTPISFDGKWEPQKLTEREYNLQFGKDDARYARMLQLLARELGKKTTTP